ncbi:MAG: AIR synthase related protein [Chloroflexota bacterium]|nr:AIR synthase related protein [Chloroflexota bacterium]
MLARIEVRDPRVLLGPRVGADAALIDYGDRILVAKTDPITFATELIGWYAVHVNANDVACMGTRPRWFLATLLLPEGAPASQAEAIFDQIVGACHSLEVTLVGGHTEVTYSLPRPIIVGCMLGEVAAGRQVDSRKARPGDAIVLTAGIAIEGTALLAREAAGKLLMNGVPQSVIESAKALLFTPGISVVRAALIACENCDVHALHDPTEGGLATALHELAHATALGVVVQQERITVLPATRSMCAALGLDPLGLLASGALLIAVPPGGLTPLLAALSAADVAAQAIGVLRPASEGVRLMTGGQATPLPTFERDELARFFASQAPHGPPHGS